MPIEHRQGREVRQHERPAQRRRNEGAGRIGKAQQMAIHEIAHETQPEPKEIHRIEADQTDARKPEGAKPGFELGLIGMGDNPTAKNEEDVDADKTRREPVQAAVCVMMQHDANGRRAAQAVHRREIRPHSSVGHWPVPHPRPPSR